MYARFMAVFCLLFVSAWDARSQSSSAAGVAVDLYLSLEAPASSTALAEMQTELSSLLQDAGYRTSWHFEPQHAQAANGDLVVVQLRGICNPPDPKAHLKPIQNLQSLASSSVSDGKVLPFIWADCSALSSFLNPSLKDVRRSDRDYMYGRAMARLLAHELYHVLAQTMVHTQSGIAKPKFTTGDLTTDHLEFEPEALEELRR